MVNLSLISCFHRMFRYPKSFLWKAVIRRPSAELMRKRCSGKLPGRPADSTAASLGTVWHAGRTPAQQPGPSPRGTRLARVPSAGRRLGGVRRSPVAEGHGDGGTKGHQPGRWGRPPPRTGSLLPPALLRARCLLPEALAGVRPSGRAGSQQPRETAAPSVAGRGLPPPALLAPSISRGERAPLRSHAQATRMRVQAPPGL